MRPGRRAKGGAQRMLENGRCPAQLWFSSAELDQVRQAARSCGIPMATWMKRLAVAASLQLNTHRYACDFLPLFRQAGITYLGHKSVEPR